METTAIILSISVAVVAAILIPFVMSGPQAKAAEEKARARRLKDAQMNARLLRLNL